MNLIIIQKIKVMISHLVLMHMVSFIGNFHRDCVLDHSSCIYNIYYTYIYV